MREQIKCFYLESIGASGNIAFRKFANTVYKTYHSVYWDANAHAWQCQKKQKKINRVYKGRGAELQKLWWLVHDNFGLKLNGIDLGHLYIWGNRSWIH